MGGCGAMDLKRVVVELENAFSIRVIYKGQSSVVSDFWFLFVEQFFLNELRKQAAITLAHKGAIK